MLSSGHQQLGLDVLVSKWLWGKRTVNSSRLCRCAPASSPCPRPPPVTSWTERMSTDCWLPMCELCSWALGTGVQIKPLGVLSRLGLAMGSLTHLRPAALAGAPVEHRMWAKPRLPPLSPVEPSAMAAALPGRCCHGPISLLTETLGPGPAPSTATPVGTPQRPARQTQCWHLKAGGARRVCPLNIGSAPASVSQETPFRPRAL